VIREGPRSHAGYSGGSGVMPDREHEQGAHYRPGVSTRYPCRMNRCRPADSGLVGVLPLKGAQVPYRGALQRTTAGAG